MELYHHSLYIFMSCYLVKHRNFIFVVIHKHGVDEKCVQNFGQKA